MVQMVVRAVFKGGGVCVCVCVGGGGGGGGLPYIIFILPLHF